VAKNHPFVDGNKRAAFLALGLFLYLNGQRLTATQAEATLAVMAVATSEWDEATLAAWLRERVAPRLT
jgi:death-on-curing protein